MRDNHNYIDTFVEILKLRNYSQNTIKTYRNYLLLFLQAFNNNLNGISDDKIRKFILFCAEGKNYSRSALKHQLYSIKLFYEIVLNIKLNLNFAKKFRKEFKLPKVLSAEDVQKIISAISNIKHKAIISTKQ